MSFVIYQIVMEDNIERVEAANEIRAQLEGLEVIRIPAVRWEHDPEGKPMPYYTSPEGLEVDLDMEAQEQHNFSFGHIGCSASHQLVYQNMIRRHDSAAIILEDDVVDFQLAKAFDLLFEARRMWDPGLVLQFGDTLPCFEEDYHAEPVIRHHGQIEEVIRWPFTTHCYAIDQPGARWAAAQNNPIAAQADVLFYNPPKPERFHPGARRNIARLRTGFTPNIATTGGFNSLTSE